MAKVIEGSTCAIWGLGAIGLSAVLGCKALGAKRIIGIDVNNDKEKIARQLGCNEFFNPKTSGKYKNKWWKLSRNSISRKPIVLKYFPRIHYIRKTYLVSTRLRFSLEIKLLNNNNNK